MMVVSKRLSLLVVWFTSYRFDDETKQAFLELYDKVDDTVQLHDNKNEPTVG